MYAVPSELFRYSKRTHLDSFLKSGAIRLRPASYYCDSALTDAQQNDELARRIQLDPNQYRLLVSQSHGPHHGFGMLLDMNVTLKMVTPDGITFDYYLFCTSQRFDRTLYPDFCADACVHISDPKQFAERLYAACKRSFKECVMYFADVWYFDPKKPLLVKTIKDLVFYKDSDKYSSQSEYRFAIALDPSQKLREYYDIELESLDDIAEYEEG